MGRLLICAVLGLGAAACQPLYGGKAQKMRNPDETRPAVTTPTTATEIAWDDECDSQFHDPLTKAKPNTVAANQKITAAQSDMTQASPAAVEPAKKSALVLDAIEQYKLALHEDPYSADATYGLAVAYATIYKRKCALDLIGRLVALRGHPTYEPDATRLISAAYSEAAFQPFKSKLP